MSPMIVLLVGTVDGLVAFGPSGAGLAQHWHTFTGRPVRAVAAVNSQTFLAAPDDLPPQQSFDGGDTWFDAAGIAIEPIGLRAATLYGPQALAAPRLMGATAYARLAGKPPLLLGAGAGGMLLFRSGDDGIHWEPAALPLESVGRVTALAPAPDGGAWAVTDTGVVLRSGDRGLSWREVARTRAAALCAAPVDTPG